MLSSDLKAFRSNSQETKNPLIIFVINHSNISSRIHRTILEVGQGIISCQTPKSDAIFGIGTF